MRVVVDAGHDQAEDEQEHGIPHGLTFDEAAAARAPVVHERAKHAEDRRGRAYGGAGFTEEARQVEPDEEPGQRLCERLLGRDPAREERSEWQRELEIARHEDGLELLACGREALRDDPDRLDGRHVLGAEVAEEPVLALGEPLRELLQREVGLGHLDEADDVPAESAFK